MRKKKEQAPAPAARSYSGPDPRIKPERNPGTWSRRDIEKARESVATILRIMSERPKEEAPAPSAKGAASAPAPRAARKPRTAVDASPPENAAEIVKLFEKLAKDSGTCAALREIGARFPALHHKQIAAALPSINPGTIGIQVKKGRAL